MDRQRCIATALSTVAFAAVLSGCAAGQQHRESIFGSKVDHENIGLATRAQAALASEQYGTAIDLAERAVANTPNDAGFRALLGNCYFASGRFASAEQAFSDSLALIPAQADLTLKLALVQIAQGKNDQALATLDSARGMLDAADYGLAVALAGRSGDAVAVLDDAARMTGADSRVRQNLALAYGLSGDWEMARAVAAQDVPADQLDSRIQQWMAMATPTQASDQVAALTGVRPSADPGQPMQLALKNVPDRERYAQLVVPQTAPKVPVPATAEVPATPPPALPVTAPTAQASEAAAPVMAAAAHSLIEPAVTSQPAVSAEAPASVVVAELPTHFDAPVEPAKYVSISDAVRGAAEEAHGATGRSNSVVQLGAYSSPERVAAAWNILAKRYPALAKYTPMRARFDGPNGTVWRLSIRGFASQDEAMSKCDSLQSKGGQCFVRRVAGDAPVQMASR